MGSTLSNIGNGIVNGANATVQALDDCLDYISVNWCPEKPTYDLVMKCLHLPERDSNILQDILETFLANTIGLVTITPFRKLTDKKFIAVSKSFGTLSA